MKQHALRFAKVKQRFYHGQCKSIGLGTEEAFILLCKARIKFLFFFRVSELDYTLYDMFVMILNWLKFKPVKPFLIR
jgi:hypothetical protein